MAAMQTPADIAIRPYRAEDREQLIARVRELQAHERALEPRMKAPDAIGAWYLDGLLAKCRAHKGAVLVADNGGAVVGYACILAEVPCEEADEDAYSYALLSDLAVNPAERGKGIGRRLIAACETHARAHGATWLRIGVLAANEAAMRLYRASGFEPRYTELEMPLDASTG